MEKRIGMKSKTLLAIVLSGVVVLAACNADKDTTPVNDELT